MWEAAIELYNYFLNKRMKHHWVKTLHYNKVRALLRRVFPNYISFTTSLINASQQKLRILW